MFGFLTTNQCDTRKLIGFSPVGTAFLLQSENVLVQTKRFRGKINIQRPKPPHYERALFNAVTQPIYEKIPLVVECREKEMEKWQRGKFERAAHPYEKILATELYEAFETSEMVLICQKNAIKSFDFFQFKVALHKKDVKLKVSGPQVLKTALKDTKYDNLHKILNLNCCMLFGNASSVVDILKILRKWPQIILLAGTMSDRILSKNQLVEYSQLPDLQTVRAQFAATLNTSGGQILNNLQAHQSNLCYMLDAHAKALGEATSDKPAADDASPAATETKTE